ncbi:hypothetical protein ACFLRN_07170 [Thermoproteota archaeon]
MNPRLVNLPQLKFKKNLVLFDVGHGECILIFDGMLKSFLVDCGALYSRKHLNVPRWIERILPNNNSSGFVISHYHIGHYNLFQCFKRPNFLFSNIYVPNLPTKGVNKHVSYVLMEFIAVANVINFRNYRILPDIFRRFKKTPIPLQKGDLIHEMGLSFRVFWPDPKHKALNTKAIITKAKKLRKKIKPWIDKYEISIPDEDVSIAHFFGILQELSLKEVPDFEETNKVEKTLSDLDGIFKECCDLLSIGFQTQNGSLGNKFLFLGDLKNSILNNIIITKNNFEYDFVKASHHGTRFGRSLKNISTEFVLVSRNETEYPRIRKVHPGYYKKIRCRILLNTNFSRTCHIRGRSLFIN